MTGITTSRPSSPPINTSTPAAPAAPAPTTTSTPAAQNTPATSSTQSAPAPTPTATPRTAQDAATAQRYDLEASQVRANVANAGGGGPVQRGASTVDYGKHTAGDYIAARPTSGDAEAQWRMNRETPVDINAGTPEQQAGARRELIEGTPQVNDTAIKAGNSQAVCGAAAQTNALIMTDHNGNNAKALEKAANDQGINLSGEEQQAIDNFKSGKLAPKDVEQLQQVVYRTGVKLETGSEPGTHVTPEGLELAAKTSWYKPTAAEQSALAQFKKGPETLSAAQTQTLNKMAENTGLTLPGQQLDASKPVELNAGGMGALATTLRGNGAFNNGENITFNNSAMTDAKGHTFNHWTAQVGDQTYNSLAKTPGGPSQVSDTPPPEVATKPSASNFKGRVSLSGQGGNQTMNIDTPNPDNSTYSRIQYKPQSDSDAAWARGYNNLVGLATNRAHDDSMTRRDLPVGRN